MTTEQPPTFPFGRTCPFAPHDEHVELRETDSVREVALPSGSGRAWAVTRHEDIRALLADARVSSDRNNPRFPLVGPNEEAGSADGVLPPMLVNMDGPRHREARRALVGEFTAKRANQLKPRIQEIVDEHIDAMLAGPKPVDLVRALSLPVPSLVICELLGLPYEDHAFFQGLSSTMVAHDTRPDELNEALYTLATYLGELIRVKVENPGDDLLSRQIVRQLRDNGEVDFNDLLGLSFLLLVAGHETTANMISLSVLQLSQRPELREALLQDPGKTLPAVEELLRYFTIAEHTLVRLATSDIGLGDRTIRAGEGVVALAHAGNRDPRAFPNPDEFDIERDARNHLSFGFGPHQCLGQHLARTELQVVLDTLVRRLPDIRPAVPVAELAFKDDALVYGVRELPVTW